MKKLIDIQPCKWVGDKDDEFCVDCNGMVIHDDEGEEISALNCGGYEVEEVVETEEIENNTNVVDKVVVEVQSDPEIPSASNDTTQSNTNTPTSTIIEMQAESGVSIEVKGTWYKLAYTEKRSVPANANIEEERSKLWDDVNSVVDDQVQSILK